MSARHITAVSVVALLLSGSPPAQPPAAVLAQPAGSAKPEGPVKAEGAARTRIVSYRADLERTVNGRTHYLIGHVSFEEGDTRFVADRIVFDEETKKGEAVRDPSVKGGSIGDPKVTNALDELTGDHFVFDLSPKDAKLKVVSAVGRVRFVTRPRPKDVGAIDEPPPQAGKNGTSDPPSSQPSKSEARARRKLKEPTTLTCNRLDYYYRVRRAVATGSPRVEQGKRWLTGDQAIYYGRFDTVVVNGAVHGEDEKGRTFNARSMKMVLGESGDTIEAEKFHGTFTLDEETAAEDDAAPPVFTGAPLAP